MKNTIINSIVNHAADVMEAKAKDLETRAEFIRDLANGGISERADKYTAESAEIRKAVALIRDRSGDWA